MGSGARVYGYINIDTSTPGSTQSALIHIRVPVSWYEESGLDPTTTAVTHCGDTSTEWETLDVVDSSSDSEYYYFTVRTPGFSEFSVAALPYAQAEVIEEDADADETGTDGAAEESEDEGSSGFLWLIPVVTVILGLLVFVIWKGKREE